MNYWATFIPGLMYLASIGSCLSPQRAYSNNSANIADIALGLSPLYQRNGPGSPLATSYYSVSSSLNLLLTLMIIARLVLHSRNFRNAVGASSGAGGLYTAVVTMLVESSALYTVTLLLYFVPAAAHSYVAYIFIAAGEIQVRAVFAFPQRTASLDTV